MRSEDCVSWTTTYSPAGLISIWDITYAEGLFVAAGVGNAAGASPILISPDGLSWTDADLAMPAAYSDLYVVARGGGQFVALGQGSFDNLLLTSEDGAHWTPRPAPSGLSAYSLNDLAYGNGQFVLVTDVGVWTSPDELVWSRRSGWSFESVVFAAGRFVAVGANGRAHVSRDGAFWSPTITPTIHDLRGVTASADGERLVAVGDSVVLVTDAPPRTVSVGGASIAEGNGGAVSADFAVTLSTPAAEPVSVSYVTADETATAGIDYVAASGLLTFAPGETATTVSVPVTGDTTPEGNEVFTLNLSNPSRANIGEGTGRATILDDDLPELRIDDVSVSEGDSGWTRAYFTVSLSSASSQTVTVDWATESRTATTDDFFAASDTLTFGPGWQSQTILAWVAGDKLVEPDETFVVRLSNSVNAVIGDTDGNVTILDDDAQAKHPTTLNWTTSLEGLATVHSLATDGSVYVAVGNFGEIFTSTDGVSWTERANPDTTGRDLYGVTWGGGRFVAVGGCCLSNGFSVALTSPDGVTWTETHLGSFRNFNDVAYANGLYVAVGSGGTIATSSDGSTWSLQTSGTGFVLHGVAFGGGVFVAVGYDRTILTSPDGYTWTPQTAPSTVGNSLYAVTHTGTQFVVAGSSGGVLTSPDGVSWTQQTVLDNSGSPSTDTFRAIAVGGGRIALAAFSSWEPFYTSTDGVTWTSRAMAPAGPGEGHRAYALTYGSSGFVAAGYSGFLAHSVDGVTTWSPHTLALSRRFISVAHDGVRYCAVGSNGAFASSTDGVTWTQQSGPSGGGYSFWSAISYGEGLFTAVNYDGDIASSTDCSSWTERYSESSQTLYDVLYGGSRFVAVGSSWENGASTSLVLVSDDGQSWSRTSSGLPAGDSFLNTVGYGNGRFVAVGTKDEYSAPLLVTSADGVQWVERPSPFDANYWGSGYTEELYSITYGNGLFVAVGDRLWTSPDGLSWTLRSQYLGAYDVAFSGDRFVTVGYYSGITVSTDGMNWTTNATPSTHSVSGVTVSADGTRFVAVGDSVILTTAPVPLTVSIGHTTVTEGTGGDDAQFNVALSAPSLQTVTVEYSTAEATATRGIDYQEMSGTLTFAPGTTQQTILVPIASDGETETSPEIFYVDLANPTNAILGNDQGLGTILDPSAASGCTALTDRILSNTTLSLTTLYEACNSITAGPSFTILSPGDVTFRAGTSIVLGNGFQVAAGAKIKVEIDPSLNP